MPREVHSYTIVSETKRGCLRKLGMVDRSKLFRMDFYSGFFLLLSSFCVLKNSNTEEINKISINQRCPWASPDSMFFHGAHLGKISLCTTMLHRLNNKLIPRLAQWLELVEWCSLISDIMGLEQMIFKTTSRWNSSASKETHTYIIVLCVSQYLQNYKCCT